MNEENNKVTRITVDLSTSVKPIQISEEEALKKLEEDNRTQAQYKEENLESTTESPEAGEKQDAVDAMREANKTFDLEAFNKANETLGTLTPEERAKQATKILIIILVVLFVIFIIELPTIINNLK